MQKINCRSCGSETDATKSYCHSCGTRLPFRPRRASAVLGVALTVMIVITALLAAALVAAMDENARLEDEYEDFDRTKRTLENEIAALQGNNTGLEEQMTYLEDEIDYLESIIASLQGNTSDLEDELAEWWYIYGLRTGQYPQDLVTPDDPTMISESAQILGADADGDLTWDDMYAINDWVYDNILYSNDPYITNPYNASQQDYWQTPVETLDRGEGDCEDLANLALSLMLAEENVPWLWGARVVFSGGGGHVAIFVNVENDQMSVLDPTWGWASPSSTAETDALDEWAGQGGHAGVSWVLKAYSSLGVEEFETLQEFLGWF